MATIAEIHLPAGVFALSYTFDTIEDMNIEMERIAASCPALVMPYLWTTSAEPTELEQVLAEDATVDAVEKVAQPADDEALYQIEWIDSVQVLVHILLEEEGMILAVQKDVRTAGSCGFSFPTARLCHGPTSSMRKTISDSISAASTISVRGKKAGSG